MTRDSIVWWLGIVGAIVLFLIADGRPPTDWSYIDWLKFIAGAIGTISGKLASSPLKHSED